MEMGMALVAMITTTHSSSRSPLQPTVGMVLLHLRSLLLLRRTLQVVLPLTRMLSMVVTRTIWPCGMLHLPNSSSKEALPLLGPRRARFDATHVAETSSHDACLHDHIRTLLRVA
jgi:hypothetical protein